jgi:hypothetical protein
MTTVGKFPMLYDIYKGKYNKSLINKIQEYLVNVGYIFAYEENRNKDYTYKKEDILGQLSKQVFITLDKEIELLIDVINPQYEYMFNYPFLFYYIWPIMETKQLSNGYIEVTEIKSLELII